MHNHSGFRLIVLIVMASLLLSACSLPFGGAEDIDPGAIVQTAVAQTQTAVAEAMMAEGDADADIDPTPTDTATITLTATMTQIPTETLTPTPDTPRVRVDVNTNCRLGPGEDYDIVGSLLVNEEAEIVGQYRGGNYWVVENPDGAGECWIWGYYATQEGPTEGLPYFTQPPTPTPVIDWSGSWTTLYGAPGGPYTTNIVTVNQTNSSVTGSFVDSITGFTINMSGSLSADYMTWSGTWNSGAATGPFLWHWLNPNQFNGNESNGNYAWCGYRSGGGQPSPCLYP